MAEGTETNPSLDTRELIAQLSESQLQSLRDLLIAWYESRGYALLAMQMAKEKERVKYAQQDLDEIINTFMKSALSTCSGAVGSDAKTKDEVFAELTVDAMRALLGAAEWCEEADCDANVDHFAWCIANIGAAALFLMAGGESRAAYAKQLMDELYETAKEKVLCGVIFDRETGKLDWGWRRTVAPNEPASIS